MDIMTFDPQDMYEIEQTVPGFLDSVTVRNVVTRTNENGRKEVIVRYEKDGKTAMKVFTWLNYTLASGLPHIGVS